MDEICKNCEANKLGTYCHRCGEKTLDKDDFLVRQYVGSFVSSLTNLDSKFYRTLKAFIGQPGRLSADYFRGLRKPFLSPIQIFLIVTVLFFIFAPEFDVFYIPAKWLFANIGLENSGFINHLATEKMAKLGLSQNELFLKYDVSVKNYAKAFLFLAIPCLALGSFLSRPKTAPQFGKHMIFATYNLSFFIVWMLLLLYISFKVPNNWTPDWLMRIISLSGVYIYFLLANKRTWADSWPRAALSGFLQLFVIALFILTYRTGISIATLLML